jgi:hypothetical protein
MNERPTLIVSSTVYGHEKELDVIYAILVVLDNLPGSSS